MLLRSLPTLACSTALLVTLYGCQGDAPTPTEPASREAAAELEFLAPELVLEGSWNRFYPLSIGSHWRYRRLVTIQDLDANGNPIGSPIEFPADVETETIGTETLQGREYVVEREIIAEAGGAFPTVYWTRFRQDRSGLFVFDAYACDPPGPGTCREAPYVSAAASRNSVLDRASAALASRGSTNAERAAFRAAWTGLLAKRDRVHAVLRPGPGDISGGGKPPGGPLEGEFVRLRYPLRRGAEWELRPGDGFDFRYRVVGHELLRLPAGRFPAVRIRVLSDTFGPEDRVHVWYGRCGYLRLELRFIAEVRSPEGVVLGKFLATESQVLEDLTVVGRRGCGR